MQKLSILAVVLLTVTGNLHCLEIQRPQRGHAKAQGQPLRPVVGHLSSHTSGKTCGKTKSPPSLTPNPPVTSRIHHKIVNGAQVPRGGMPWACAIVVMPNFQFCDCTLIDRQWVVTAGHCVEHDSESRIKRIMKIFVGSTDLTEVTDENKRTIARVFKNPEYNSETVVNDVALIKLAEPIAQFSDTLSPVCLPTVPVTAVAVQTGAKRRRLCFVAGWGTLYENQRGYIGSGTDQLMQTAIEIFAAADCEEYLATQPLSSTMICGGYDSGVYDACLGDSGGPLVCDAGDGTWTLNGIVSWGSGCAEPGKPGFYTNVFAMVPWITKTMAAN